MNLNKMAERVHKANKKWWISIDTGRPIERDPLELIALIITELSEALEGERRNLMDDKLPNRKMAEVEMADALIRLLDFAGGFGHHLSKWDLTCPIPGKKSVQIFRIMQTVMRMDGCMTPAFINLSIAQIIWYCQDHGYDLMGAYEEKMVFNAKREDHKHEARLMETGKKF